jgi:hypothetical protein
MLVRSEGGPLVALAASTSGRAGAFALSMGVPLPAEPSAPFGEGVAP